MNYEQIKNLLDKVWPGWNPVRLIGEGSFGTVYEIRKVNGNMVDFAALKVISIPKEGAAIPMGKDKQTLYTYYESIADEMVQEYEIMSKLKQAGCMNVVDCDTYVKVPNNNGLGLKLFIQMELLTDLNTYTQKNGFSRQNIIQLGIDICKALESCQNAHVIHRDIKPPNLFFSAEGVFKLGDFGVAKRLEETGYAGSKQGTILYMAPEVYANQPYDIRADIYSLGLVMYQLLNKGELPFDTGIFSNHEQGESFRKRMRGDKVPMPGDEESELGKIICKACEHNYRDRYNTPDEMRKELEQLLAFNDDKMVLFPIDIGNETDIIIRFVSDEGLVLKEEIYQSGQLVFPPELSKEIERNGIRYQFEGWEPAVPEKATVSMECKAIYKEAILVGGKHKKNKKIFPVLAIAILLLLGLGAVALDMLKKPSMVPSDESQAVAENETTEEKKPEIDDENIAEKNEVIKKEEWSDWVVNLPNYVKSEKYDIEEKTLYRSRQLETTSSTEQSSMSGWELYDSIDSVGEWGPWSDWSTTAISSNDMRDVETKTQYRYRDLKTTVSEDDHMDGWEVNDVTYTQGGWGSWSSWSTSAVSSSNSRNVETKTQYRRREIISNQGYSSWGSWSGWQDDAVSNNDLTEVQTRTVYPYYYFWCYNCGLGARFPYWGYICEVCGTTKVSGESGTVDWFETPWSNSTFWGNNKYYQYINGGIWWNWGDGAPKTQYRYRTRATQSNTSYGSWSDWSDTQYSSSSNWEVQTRTMYRYQDASTVPVYHYERWGSWSEWSDSAMSGSDTREVETLTQYRYREKITQKTYYFCRWSDWSEYTEKELKESDTLQVEKAVRYRYRRK